MPLWGEYVLPTAPSADDLGQFRRVKPGPSSGNGVPPRGVIPASGAGDVHGRGVMEFRAEACIQYRTTQHIELGAYI